VRDFYLHVLNINDRSSVDSRRRIRNVFESFIFGAWSTFGYLSNRDWKIQQQMVHAMTIRTSRPTRAFWCKMTWRQLKQTCLSALLAHCLFAPLTLTERLRILLSCAIRYNWCSWYVINGRARFVTRIACVKRTRSVGKFVNMDHQISL